MYIHLLPNCLFAVEAADPWDDTSEDASGDAIGAGEHSM